MSLLSLSVRPTGNGGPNGAKKQPLKSWLASVLPTQPAEPSQKEQADPEVNLNQPAELDPEQAARQFIAEHPEINAATLFNALKSAGFKIVVSGDAVDQPKETEEKKEADSASANTQFLKSKESGHVDCKWKQGTLVKLAESSPRDNGIGYTKFDVVLLEEGLGNYNDAFYYTKDALKSAVSIFEGRKAFADHADAMEEQVRPERSVKDICGHFENLSYQETDGGVGQLLGTLCVLPDKPYEWVRGLLRHAVEFSEKFPDKEFVGLSINAGGVAAEISLDEFLANYNVPKPALGKITEAKEKGIETIRVVSVIEEATSCDLVTEAGAGGKINNLKESEGKVMKKFKERMAAMRKKLKEQGSDVAPSDSEVIKKMMMDEMAEMGMECSEAEIAEMYEMYGKAKEMDLDDDEAMDLVKKMKKLQGMGDKVEEADDKEEKPAEEKPAEEVKESAEGKSGNMDNIKSAAKIAALESRLDKKDTAEYVDKKLKESKLPRSVTKKFREAAGEIKSTKDFDSKWKVFLEAHNSAYESMGVESPMVEKGANGGSKSDNSYDFSGCVK